MTLRKLAGIKMVNTENFREKIRQLREKEIQKRRKALKIIVEKLKDRAEKISVFGSVARGEDGLFSDLDVLIIMHTKLPFLERLKELYTTLELPVDVDILCYTPEEFEKIKKRGFFKKILSEEKVLYERKKE